MSECSQLLTQLREVVDRPVENDDVATVGALHRLTAGVREVEDGQTSESQSDTALQKHAGAVGSPMGEPFRGHGEHRSVDWLAIGRNNANETTHPWQGDWIVSAESSRTSTVTQLTRPNQLAGVTGEF